MMLRKWVLKPCPSFRFPGITCKVWSEQWVTFVWLVSANMLLRLLTALLKVWPVAKRQRLRNWWFLANHVWMEVSHLSQQAGSLSSRCGRCSLLLSMFAFRGQQVELKKIATKASPYYFQEAVRPPCVARVHHVQHGRQIRVWPPCSYTVYHVLTWQPPFFIKGACAC